MTKTNKEIIVEELVIEIIQRLHKLLDTSSPDDLITIISNKHTKSEKWQTFYLIEFIYYILGNIERNHIDQILQLVPEEERNNRKQFKLVAKGIIEDLETTKNTLKFIFKSGEFDYTDFPFSKEVQIIIREVK